MRYWQIRLFALVIALVSGAMIYYNWQQAVTEGTYSFRIAGLAPIGVVFGIYLLFFPAKIGRPETALDKFLVFLLLAIGTAAGAYNWYLMDPGKFEELWQAIRSAL
jgi:hypothetical protein